MQESFFTQAPYKYRPSIAGYLTNMKVDLNSMIADVLYLDKKNKINITKYNKNEIHFEIKSKADLDYSEDFLISILEHEHQNNTFDLNRLKKHVTVYESSIIKEMQGQFNLNIGLAQMKGLLPHVFLGIAANMVIGWITGMCGIFFFPAFFVMSSFGTYPTTSTFGLPFLLFATMYIGIFLAPYAVISVVVRQKLKKSPLEKKYLFKTFFWELVKLYFISLLKTSFSFLSSLLISLSFCLAFSMSKFLRFQLISEFYYSTAGSTF